MIPCLLLTPSTSDRFEELTRIDESFLNYMVSRPTHLGPSIQSQFVCSGFFLVGQKGSRCVQKAHAGVNASAIF